MKAFVRLTNGEPAWLSGTRKQRQVSAPKIPWDQVLPNAKAEGPNSSDVVITMTVDSTVKMVENIREPFIGKGFEFKIDGKLKQRAHRKVLDRDGEANPLTCVPVPLRLVKTYDGLLVRRSLAVLQRRTRSPSYQ